MIRYSVSSEPFAHLEKSFCRWSVPGLGSSTSERCLSSQKPPCAVFFLSKDPSRKPHKTFSTLLALLWVMFEGIGSLPLQHFALSTSSRHLVAKDCIHQLPRWKANKSFPPLCCPTPNLGMTCNVMSEPSVIFRAQ